jgi:predicted dehydrogenase
MIRVGILGIGFMGTTHFMAVKNLPNARVAALCTRDEKKLSGDWRHIQGNFGSGGGMQDLSGIKTYREIDGILNDPDVDLIDICLPTAMHCDVAMRALEAGKHVLVEKPIALNLEDADRMIEKAKAAGKRLMVAQVLRFFPEFAFVKRVIEDGRYGRFLGLHLKRVISKPLWGSGDWFGQYEQTGAAGIDLHIHDSDFVQYLFGMPDQVYASGLLSPNGYVLYLSTHYGFDGQDITVTAQCGSIGSAKFEHGYDAYFEDGALWFNSLSGLPVTLYTRDGGKETPEIPGPEAFPAQLGYAVDCLEKGVEPAILSGASGRNSLLICLKEAESVRTGQTVKVKG